MENVAGSYCAKFTVADGTFTDASIKGTTLSGGVGAAIHDAPTGAGAYTDCEVDCIYRAPLSTAGAAPFSNPNTILLRVKSPYYGTSSPNGANGSVYQDTTNGTVKHRKGLSWCPLVASQTYDPPSLADGAGVTTTVGVFGAAPGDRVTAGFSNDLQGVTLTAYSSAANVVSVRFQNETGGVLDLASGTLTVHVEKT